MNAYVSAKFEGDDNEETVNALCTAVERAGFLVHCTNRDFDDFGRQERELEELIPYIEDAIERTDVVILDLTDKGVGLGVEAGFAAALQKPIVAVLHEDADPPTTIQLLAKRIVTYQGFEDLTHQLSNLKSLLLEQR